MNSRKVHERIVKSDRVMHNYNPEPVPQPKARVFKIRNILPNLETASYISIVAFTGLALAVGGSSYLRNAAEDKKAEAIINKEVVAHADYNHNGIAEANERRIFLDDATRGKAYRTSTGAYASLDGQKILTIEDLAKMATEYSPKQ